VLLSCAFFIAGSLFAQLASGDIRHEQQRLSGPFLPVSLARWTRRRETCIGRLFRVRGLGMEIRVAS
jgi:hypothetical protein